MQSDEELINLSVKDIVENLVNKVVSAIAKSEEARKVAGKKCHHHSAALKVEAINAYNNGELQESIAELFVVNQRQI